MDTINSNYCSYELLILKRNNNRKCHTLCFKYATYATQCNIHFKIRSLAVSDDAREYCDVHVDNPRHL